MDEKEGWQMAQALQIPEGKTRVLVEYPDGSRYVGGIDRLEYYQKQAEEMRDWALSQGAPEEVANRALFMIVEFLD